MTERERNFLSASGLDATATPAMMRSVARIAALIALVIGAAIPFRSIVIGLFPGIYMVYGIALVAGYSLSGLLLGWWSRRSSNHGVTILAATYLFAAVMVLTNVILIIEPNRSPGAMQASLWFWLLWHIGIPLGILASTVRRPCIGGRLREAVVVAAGASAAAFAFVWFGSHHLIVVANNQTTMRVLDGLWGRRRDRRTCAVASFGAAIDGPRPPARTGRPDGHRRPQPGIVVPVRLFRRHVRGACHGSGFRTHRAQYLRALDAGDASNARICSRSTWRLPTVRRTSCS